MVIEKFILEPTEWNMKFQSRVAARDKQIEALRLEK
jgi:hypothetical protein